MCGFRWAVEWPAYVCCQLHFEVESLLRIMKPKTTFDKSYNIFLNYAGASVFNIPKGETKLGEDNLPRTPTSEDTSSMNRLEPGLEPHENIFFNNNPALDFGPERDFEMWTPACSPGPQRRALLLGTGSAASDGFVLPRSFEQFQQRLFHRSRSVQNPVRSVSKASE